MEEEDEPITYKMAPTGDCICVYVCVSLSFLKVCPAHFHFCSEVCMSRQLLLQMHEVRLIHIVTHS